MSGSTGMAFSGKFDVKWNGSDLERLGEAQLPDTTENEVRELQTNKAMRREVIAKDGYQDVAIDFFFNPANKTMLESAKTGNLIGTLSYSAQAADGGSWYEEYDAKVVSVSGGSGDVEGVIESFSATFAPIKRVNATGSLGTQTYD